MSAAHRPRVRPPRRRPELTAPMLLPLLAQLDDAAIIGFEPTPRARRRPPARDP
ncbi:MAG: hypothetical protein ACYC2O_04615 [Microthrixaceae bacterium]